MICYRDHYCESKMANYGSTTSLEHLREEFPAPESDPGPQLSNEDSSGQVRFDLRQQFRGLPVQPIRVRQQPVIHDLLLRDEPGHIPIHGHIPVHFPAV